MEINEDSYVVQPNAISRACYIMPTMARRLIFLAILNVQVTRPADMKLTINLGDLAIQFGFLKTKRYAELKNAIDIASKQVLRFEKENGTVTEWIPWLTYCNLNLKTKQVTIHINEYLYDYVLNIRQSAGFSILLLSDYLKLESRYAYRWFEIIFSRSGQCDKNGKFFVRYNVDNIKTLFAVDEKYNSTKNFRINVIENPIAEINEKGIGFQVYPEYVYKRRKLADVILRCSFAQRDGKDPIAFYISRYPKEYFNCFAEAKRSINLKRYKNEKYYELACVRQALKLLKERIPNEQPKLF